MSIWICVNNSLTILWTMHNYGCTQFHRRLLHKISLLLSSLPFPVLNDSINLMRPNIYSHSCQNATHGGETINQRLVFPHSVEQSALVDTSSTEICYTHQCEDVLLILLRNKTSRECSGVFEHIYLISSHNYCSLKV